MRQFLLDIGFPQQQPTVIYEDNQAAINFSHNPVQQSRLRHVDIKYHAIREYIESAQIILRNQGYKAFHLCQAEGEAFLFDKFKLPGQLQEAECRLSSGIALTTQPSRLYGYQGKRFQDSDVSIV